MSVLPIEKSGNDNGRINDIENLSISDIDDREIVCRYCLDSSGNNKINPCNCKNFVHKECLQKWLLIKKDNICEICQIEYKNINADIQIQLFYKNIIDSCSKIIFCRSQYWSPIHYTYMQLQILVFVLLCIIIFVIYLAITCSVEKNCGSLKDRVTIEPTNQPTYLF